MPAVGLLPREGAMGQVLESSSMHDSAVNTTEKISSTPDVQYLKRKDVENVQ